MAVVLRKKSVPMIIGSQVLLQYNLAHAHPFAALLALHPGRRESVPPQTAHLVQGTKGEIALGVTARANFDDRTGAFFNWRDALIIIKPKTVIKWHRESSRLFWHWHDGGLIFCGSQPVSLGKRSQFEKNESFNERVWRLKTVLTRGVHA